MIEQHTLTYIASGIYLNGNRASDVFQLKGPDAAAACYAATCTASWTYDARDRLSQEVNGSGTTTTFTLDIVGNVTSEAPSGGTTITRTYSGQQLATQSSGGTTTKFLYDALGNQDCKVKSTFAGNSCPATGSDLLEDWVYDYKNRLTAYTSYDGSGNLVNSVSYTNDPLDRPVQQTSTESGSTTNYELSYLGASDQLSKEVLTGATATTKKYAYDAFGRRATLTDGANRYSYQYDPHGSVSMLLDQTGAPKASYGYSAYGNPNNALTKTAAGFNAKTNPYRYTGKRADPGSATLDMGARRYLPATGRFLQYDYYNGSLANLGLALNPLSSNRYALAAGNPVNYVETDGHMVLLDETRGKPLTGYGSGANTGAPVATSEESAAMLVAAANTFVSDGKAMCLGDGGYSFAGDFCQSLTKESLALRGRANLFAGGGGWSAAAQRWLNLSNTVLLAGAAGCGVFALATAGTGGMTCAAIYAGATATSGATTAIAATKIATRRGSALDNAGLFASTINAACLLSLKGEARRACVAITGTIGGIVSAATTADDIRRIRAQQFREDR